MVSVYRDDGAWDAGAHLLAGERLDIACAERGDALRGADGERDRVRRGDPYELHHIGQHQDSPFAELTWAEHKGDGNFRILHHFDEESEIDREQFDKEKSDYWMARFNAFTEDEKRRIYSI